MMMMGGGMVLFFLSFIIMFSLLACAVLSRIRFINYYVLLCAFFTFFSFFFVVPHSRCIALQAFRIAIY